MLFGVRESLEQKQFCVSSQSCEGGGGAVQTSRAKSTLKTSMRADPGRG